MGIYRNKTVFKLLHFDIFIIITCGPNTFLWVILVELLIRKDFLMSITMALWVIVVLRNSFQVGGKKKTARDQVKKLSSGQKTMEWLMRVFSQMTPTFMACKFLTFLSFRKIVNPLQIRIGASKGWRKYIQITQTQRTNEFHALVMSTECCM